MCFKAERGQTIRLISANDSERNFALIPTNASSRNSVTTFYT
jgi:hypothetical protein